MFRPSFNMSTIYAAMSFLVLLLFSSIQTVHAETVKSDYHYQVVNGDALRGLSSISSAEPMGAGRITFSFMPAWYQQQKEYATSPNVNADIFTGTGAFSYGVNSYVDLFTSITGFGISSYTKSDKGSGFGTIRAGVQGSIPFPKYAFLHMAGQGVIIGGTSQNQINRYRSDGYNYFDTRNKYSFMGKLMQTFTSSSDNNGVKLHLNEGGVIGINKNEPALLLLGAGLQGTISFVTLGMEINSRTKFNDMAFGTDPLWVTPSIHISTPYNVSGQAGVDISLSKDRTDDNPRALEPYRVFAAVAFSIDLLKNKRKAELEKQQKASSEKAALAGKAVESKNEINSLTVKSTADSIALVNVKNNASVTIDSMQNEASMLAKKATVDSLSLNRVSANLAQEKELRSDAEKQLLSTGELVLNAVYFNTGDAILTINSKPYLTDIGKMLLKYPKLNIIVAGHTDNIGSQTSNLTLSQNRAEAVRYYLIGVAPGLTSMLDAKGFGMESPKADNNTAAGRQTNRRVELRVKNMAALQEYSAW